jgi:putative copper resistance protein D
MQDIQGIANFTDDLMSGFQLISFCIAIGSVLWAFFVLRAGRTEDQDMLLLRCSHLLRIGAYTLGVTQAIELLLKALILSASLGDFPISAYFATVQFKAGVLRVVLALLLGITSERLRNAPSSRSTWTMIAALTIPIVLSGAWLVHAIGRFENRVPLMLMTISHQVAAAAWFGGVAQLLSLWQLSLRDASAKIAWPIMIARFSRLGIVAVLLLLATGIPLAWSYIGTWEGLFGTGYGSLVATKIALLVIALYFAYLNFTAGRRWLHEPAITDMTVKVPHYVAGESFILVSILFIAATLSSQPPAIDIKNLTARASEVAEMFSPKTPRIISPTHEELLAGEAGRVAVVGKIPSQAATYWSDYNHNMAGIFLTIMAIVAMLSYIQRLRWARYWPLGFVILGIFLFFRSDAETWPMGPIGFWESTFKNGEVFQHRLATLLVFTLGVLEIKARTDSAKNPRLPYMFPLLSAFGGILLLTHAHAEFQLKTEYLIQSTHVSMGLLAVILACSRWLELKLPSRGAKIAGFISVFALFLIGNCLMFYREPLI